MAKYAPEILPDSDHAYRYYARTGSQIVTASGELKGYDDQKGFHQGHKKVKLLHGNGCQKFKDCFTCPYSGETCYYDYH